MAEKNNRLLKILTADDSESISNQFSNPDNLIYKNDTESSLKKMMRFLNENEVIAGEQKLGKEVSVELYKSSIVSRVKMLFNNVFYYIADNSSYIGMTSIRDEDRILDFENTFKIKIYESNANIGFYENMEMLFGKIFTNKKSLKTEYLNYVLSHEYGHLKHIEWQNNNKLYCPIKDRKSLFLNLLIVPEVVNRATPLEILPKFMVEESWRKKRNARTFSETFADCYSLIALNKLYDKEKSNEIMSMALEHRYDFDKKGSDYKTMDAIKEIMELDHTKLQESVSIDNYLMDISTRNGFKQFINKYNRNMEMVSNLINKNESSKISEAEKNAFLEIAFIMGGLIPNAVDNSFIKNMEILEQEFGICFPFKDNHEYMKRIINENELGLSLYMKGGEVRNSLISGKEGLLVNIVNNKSDEDLVKEIDKKIKFIKSYSDNEKDIFLDYVVNREMASVFYIAGFLAEKEAIKNKVSDDKNEQYQNLLQKINVDLNGIKYLDLSLPNVTKLGSINKNKSFNSEYFREGIMAVQERSLNLKEKASLSSIYNKLKNIHSKIEDNNLIAKKNMKFS